MTPRLVTLLLTLLVPAAFAQEEVPPPVEEAPAPAASPAPPGSVRLGRMVLVPRVRLTTVGVDTNVLDTVGEPRSDFLAIGGPTLGVEVPLNSTLDLRGEGHLDYVYYARTPSQRRYTGGGSFGPYWDTGRTRLSLVGRDTREYRRLDETLDRRMEQRERSGTLDFHRRVLGRIGVRAFVFLAAHSLPDARDTNLARAFDRTELLTRGGVDYSLTYKTRLFVEVERETDAFDDAPERDGRFQGVRGGIETDLTALVSGRIVVGGRRLRMDQGDRQSPRFTYLEVDPTLNISPRTRIGVFYKQDQEFSVLSSSDLPVVQTRRWGAHVAKEFLSRVDFLARAERTEFERDEVTDHRDEAFAEVLYRWRRLGVGFRAGHVRSPASAFVRSRAFEGTVGGLVIRYR